MKFWREERDGFFGDGHTPQYYLKRLAKLGCPDELQDLAEEIVKMKPYTEEMGSGFNHVKTKWDGNSLYYYGIWEEGCFQRIQFIFDTGYVDWGQGGVQ